MIKFLLGIHNLSGNSFHFEDLNRFEMIGLKSADDVIVHISATVNFTNTAAVLIKSLTIKKKAKSYARFWFHLVSILETLYTFEYKRFLDQIHFSRFREQLLGPRNVLQPVLLQQ